LAAAQREEFPQLLFVRPGAVLRLELAFDPMDLRGLDPERRQHRAVRHAIVARPVAGRHAALVTEKELNFLPVDAEPEARREQLVHRGRRRAAGQRDSELAVSADRFTRDVRQFLGRPDDDRLRIVEYDQLALAHAAWRARSFNARATTFSTVKPKCFIAS